MGGGRGQRGTWGVKGRLDVAVAAAVSAGSAILNVIVVFCKIFKQVNPTAHNTPRRRYGLAFTRGEELFQATLIQFEWKLFTSPGTILFTSTFTVLDSRRPFFSWQPPQLPDSETPSLHQQWTPKGKKVIGCKWVYAKKDGCPDGTVRYKARLVVKGYAQRESIDYN